MNPLIVIPARLGGTRLPNKPLLLVNGIPLIRRVYDSAVAADIGPVIVAHDDPMIEDAIPGKTIYTRWDHSSGSDRVYEAVKVFDPGGVYNPIINIQGDIPSFGRYLVEAAIGMLDWPTIDIGTIAAPIVDPSKLVDGNTVKAAVSLPHADARQGRAIYFTRAVAPWNAKTYYQHIGIYAFRNEALTRFAHLRPSSLEQLERLEQLRAIENGLHIGIGIVDKAPLEINTPEDLAKAQE